MSTCRLMTIAKRARRSGFDHRTAADAPSRRSRQTGFQRLCRPGRCLHTCVGRDPERVDKRNRITFDTPWSLRPPMTYLAVVLCGAHPASRAWVHLRGERQCIGVSLRYPSCFSSLCDRDGVGGTALVRTACCGGRFGRGGRHRQGAAAPRRPEARQGRSGRRYWAVQVVMLARSVSETSKSLETP
jgi:hypothetical protein